MTEQPSTRAALIRQADAVATVIAIVSGAYGVLLGVLYEPFGSAELFTFASARWSAWLNIAAAVNAVAFMVVHRVARRAAERRGRDPGRAFEQVVFWALSLSMLISVGHVYIGGSQNTILPVSGVLIAALATWFLPWRPVMALAAVWLAGYGAVIALEVSGTLPYAPIFRDGDALARLFLDWRSVMGMTVLVLMLFGGMLALLYQFHRPLHAARAAVEEEVAARTEALQADRDSLDRHLDRLQASPAEQRVQAVERQAALDALRHRLALRVGAMRIDRAVDRLEADLRAAQDRARALGRALEAGATGRARTLFDDLRGALDDAGAARLELRGRPAPPAAEHDWASLDDIARDVLALMRPRAAEADVRTQLEMGRTPEVPVDRPALEEALYAVLDNALRAMADQRSRRLVLRTRVEARTVVLEVHDTGPGLPQADVFEAGVSRWSRPGMGLAVARAVLDAHRGTLTGGHSPHGGAVVRLGLPRPAPSGPIAVPQR